MTIDWNSFSPWPALSGGLLIGAAAAMFVLLNGRIAGISGVLGGLLKPAKGDVAWRVAFVLGLVSAPLVYGSFAAVHGPPQRVLLPANVIRSLPATMFMWIASSRS